MSTCGLTRALAAVVAVVVAGLASTADAGSASAYARAKDSSDVREAQGSSSVFLGAAYVSRTASVPGAAAGAWGRGAIFSKQGGGYGHYKASNTTNKSFKWKWSASTTDFIIDGDREFAEINLQYLAIPGFTWPDDVGPPVEFLPAVQSIYAGGDLTVNFQSLGTLTNLNTTASIPIFDGAAQLGGPDSLVPRLTAFRNFDGAFQPVVDGPDGRKIATLNRDFLGPVVRVPTNTPFSWSMIFSADTNGDDPTFEPLGHDGDGLFGSGAWFDVELGLTGNTTGLTLRAIPEPTGLALLPAAALLTLRRRRDRQTA